MSVQSRLISFTALELVFSAGFLPANAMSSCITNDCAALGYTITDTSKCTGNIIRCPYDKSKAYCVSDTCGDKFYGITQCPANATCKNCEIGGITYQKTITCNENYVFEVNEWSCKSDLCPEGYARTAADCGSSGAQGWELSSYSSQTTPAGNKCYACNQKNCNTSIYNLTSCSSGCNVCYSGDKPYYTCGSTYNPKEMYQNKCLYILIKDNIWQGSFPSACCFYKVNGSSQICTSLSGKPAYQYPISNAEISCGKVYQSGYTYYYEY